MDFAAFIATAVLGFAVGVGIGVAAAFATFGRDLARVSRLIKAAEALVKQNDAQRAIHDDDVRHTGPGPAYFRTDPDGKH